MRGLLIALLLLVPAVGMASAHLPANCAPPQGFPSLGAWALQPGKSLTFYVPRGQFITVTSLAPVEISLVENQTCVPDKACDRHASIGTVICVGHGVATAHIMNEGATPAPVMLAIGICDLRALCDALDGGAS